MGYFFIDCFPFVTQPTIQTLLHQCEKRLFGGTLDPLNGVLPAGVLSFPRSSVGIQYFWLSGYFGTSGFPLEFIPQIGGQSYSPNVFSTRPKITSHFRILIFKLSLVDLQSQSIRNSSLLLKLCSIRSTKSDSNLKRENANLFLGESLQRRS